MKLSLSTAEFLAQLQTVTRVASTRSAVQALSGVMISAQEGSTPELLATDMEIGLRVPLKVEMISGPATFHLRTLRAEDFPSLPTPAVDTRIELPAEAFVQTISRVARSA